jgi:glycosyltransferase involved in cell wall biosynthesis
MNRVPTILKTTEYKEHRVIADIETNFNARSVPEVSLVICTRNRDSKLQRCFAAIENVQSSIVFELVVIDNNSTDDTLLVVRNHARTSKIPMRWCVETKVGTGAGRNRGAEVASADIIVYLDDDCYPAPDFVDQYQFIFSRAPTLGFVGGRVELFDPIDLPITILTYTQERFFAAHERLRAGEIISANMGIRRSAFNDVRGWDDMFGAGTDFPSEDLDIAARILCSGWQGKYDPRPVVYHHHERRTQADAKKVMTSYDAGRGGFYGKCLFDKTLRGVYLWSWIRGFHRQPLNVTFREVRSFIEYVSARHSLHSNGPQIPPASNPPASD